MSAFTISILLSKHSTLLGYLETFVFIELRSVHYLGFAWLNTFLMLLLNIYICALLQEFMFPFWELCLEISLVFWSFRAKLITEIELSYLINHCFFSEILRPFSENESISSWISREENLANPLKKILAIFVWEIEKKAFLQMDFIQWV